MRSLARRRVSTGAALTCLLALALAASACTKPAQSPLPNAASGASGSSASSASVPADGAESWDRDGLAAAQPCLVALTDGDQGSLHAADLSGSITVPDLWRPPAGTSALLLDASASGPRIAMAVTQAATDAPAAMRDTLLVLGSDGVVSTASKPASDFPLVSAAVFLDGDGILWLRRRETQTSIETSMGVTNARTGDVTPVELSGSWPKHRFVASLVSLRDGNRVAVVLKTDGSPAPNDDFAVVLANYASGKLVAVSKPYRDDSLFTLGPGPADGTLVYARGGNEMSPQADELVELKPAGMEWTAIVLSRNAQCDPGFEFQHVCSGGPDEGVLYRSAVEPSAKTPPPGRLMLLPKGSSRANDTGAQFDAVGNQWLWLGKALQ